MATDELTHILQQVRALPWNAQRQLLDELTQLVNQESELPDERPLRSIVEFDGLGKHIWEGIDPDRYIEEERRTWDG